MLAEHKEIRDGLAAIAIVAYSIAEPLLDESERVPRPLLEQAVKRAPYSPPRLVHQGESVKDSLRRTVGAISDNMSDNIYHDVFGPLPWVTEQLDDLRRSAINARKRAECSGILGSEALYPHGPGRLRMQWAGINESIDRAQRSTLRLSRLAADVNDRLRDFNILEVYRPARLELDKEGSDLGTVQILAASRSLAAHVSRLEVLMDAGFTALPGGVDPADQARPAEDLLEATGELLRDLRAIAGGIRKWTSALATYRGEDQQGELSDLIRKISMQSDSLSRHVDYQNWEHFLNHATPVIEGLPPRRKRPTTADVLARSRAARAAHKDSWSDVREILEDGRKDVWAELAALDALAASELGADDALICVGSAEELYTLNAFMDSEGARWIVAGYLARSYARLGNGEKAFVHWDEFLRSTTPEVRAQASRYANEYLGAISEDGAVVAITQAAEEEGMSALAQRSARDSLAPDER
ncbi:hypothetical protein [Ornithinimicrobium cerasi]|uniref:hypothetical protein n=1 Tax=Ornithinimicrobium cerasi TaxID=2248773 RepID=UPI0011442F15|nr:hypothetical protein [Ornithinimicrobium cerasi]